MITLFKMKNNKPDWLKKVEQQAKEFNESKFAQMTDSQIDQSILATELAKIRKKNGYYQSEKHKKASKSGAISTGINNLKKLGEKEYTCSVCGKTTKTLGLYTKNHEDNCNHLVILNILKQLPSQFTRGVLKKTIEKMNLPKSFILRITYYELGKYCIKIHEGTPGSKTDVSVYKKKGDL